MELVKIKKSVKCSDGETRDFYNFYLVVEINGEQEYIAIKNSFKQDYTILNRVAKKVDWTK